jgi:parallel beta-helix repeat protein
MNMHKILEACVLTGVTILSVISTYNPSAAFGPFPVGTTIFVDGSNTCLYEDGSNKNPFTTIQKGIDAASSTAVVGVAAGVYPESVTLKSGVSLLGVDRKTTIIDGENDPGDVVEILNRATDVRVSGFTIRGALYGETAPGGAGIFVNSPSTSVKIDNNIITGNDFGIVVFNAYITSGGPTIDSNFIIDNNSVGIMFPGSGPITNNIIANNGKYGIEKSGDGIASTIVNNTIVNNGQGGIYFWDNEVTTFQNNIISGNKGFGINVETAGGDPNAKRPLVISNLFFGNTAGNFSDINPPFGTKATCNTAAEINNIPGNTGNIVADPKLVNPATEDYHLAEGSPAVDAGTNEGAPSTDFEGDIRPLDGDGDGIAITDIGADEAKFPSVSVSIDSLINTQQRACALGWISSTDVCVGLNDKLNAAKESILHARNNAAKNQLNAFIRQLNAQNSKAVNQQAYDLLMTDALYMVNHLP